MYLLIFGETEPDIYYKYALVVLNVTFWKNFQLPQETKLSCYISTGLIFRL